MISEQDAAERVRQVVQEVARMPEDVEGHVGDDLPAGSIESHSRVGGPLRITVERGFAQEADDEALRALVEQRQAEDENQGWGW